MAIRNLRVDDDCILKMKSREVTHIDDRISVLINDMKETMRANNGAGLAAPQVGVLRRIIVIDIGDGPFVFINPVITDSTGKKTDIEGCLSVTKYVGMVERPLKLVIEGYDERNNRIRYEAKDIFARAVCHEIDHLDGILITDKAVELMEKKKEKDDG